MNGSRGPPNRWAPAERGRPNQGAIGRTRWRSQAWPPPWRAHDGCGPWSSDRPDQRPCPAGHFSRVPAEAVAADHPGLLGAVAERTRRRFVFSFPPRNRVSRAIVATQITVFRLRRQDFRTFAHPPAAMLAVLADHGLRPPVATAAPGVSGGHRRSLNTTANPQDRCSRWPSTAIAEQGRVPVQVQRSALVVADILCYGTPAGAEPVEVVVLQLDPGAPGAFGDEPDLDLARVVRLGLHLCDQSTSRGRATLSPPRGPAPGTGRSTGAGSVHAAARGSRRRGGSTRRGPACG